MTAFSFSYAPKASTALASINPLKSGGEGLRFTANTPMSFLKQNPEIVTEGFWKGRQALTEGVVKGVTSALSGVTGALAQKAADAKADQKLKDDRAHDIAVANIKAAQTPEEKLYQKQRSDLLTQQIAAATTKNENVSSTQEDVVAEGDTSIIDQINSLISPAVKKVESAPSTQPSNPAPVAPAASVAPPAAPVVPNAPVAPAGVSAFAPGDAGRGLFQFDQGTGTDAYGNVPPRQASMAFNLAPLQPASIPDTTTAVASTPVPVSTRSIFGQSDNPNFTPLRDAFKNRGVISESPTQLSEQSVAPSENLSFLDINSITPEQTQSIRGEYQLPVVESSSPKLEMPEVKEQLVLNGVSLPLAQVTGAEGKKPLAAVEPVLPTAVPSEPATATPELTPERTQEQIVNEYVGLLTNKPYRGAGDARRAKQVLEKLGLKAEIETEKGEKGSRLHYVKVVDEAPAAKTAPEGYLVESIRDADGKETYVYKPKIPVKQQIATFDNNIKKANVLKSTIEKIEKIAPSTLGIFGGAGGISGLMKYNPIANDARTTRALLDTVKGIVGFDELVALKAQGGSLGALSDSELKMLTSLQGSLDPDMDEKTFMENIKAMRESTDRLISGLEADKKEVMKVESPTKFQPIQTPENRVEVKTQEEYNALKKGQKWIWNGQTGTKN